MTHRLLRASATFLAPRGRSIRPASVLAACAALTAASALAQTTDPAATATVIDATGSGDPVITDGPYLESKEHIGGFWIIEAPDLDVALALAFRTDSLDAVQLQRRVRDALVASAWPAATVPWPGASPSAS